MNYNKKNKKISKINYIVIPILSVIFILAIIFVVFFRTQKSNINDSNLIGTWKYFALSKNNIYKGQKMNNGEYIKFKKDGSASIKIDKEFKNASWEEESSGVNVITDDGPYYFNKMDSVLEIQLKDTTIYFKKRNAESDYIKKIEDKVKKNEALAQENNTTIEKIERNDDNLKGDWHIFAKEEDKKIKDARDEKKEIAIEKDKLNIITNDNKETLDWEIDTKTDTIDLEINGKKAMIFISNNVLVFVTEKSTEYYTKDISQIDEKTIENMN